MERVEKNPNPDEHRPRGYILGPDQSAQEILAVTDDLLKREGLDVAWPTRHEAAIGRKRRRSVEE